MAEYMDIYSSQIFETDYIPREAVRCEIYHNQEPLTEYQLNSIPAADMRPVVRGEWIISMESPTGTYCSNCGFAWSENIHAIKLNAMLSKIETPFCPNCGADMRKYDNG